MYAPLRLRARFLYGPAGTELLSSSFTRSRAPPTATPFLMTTAVANGFSMSISGRLGFFRELLFIHAELKLSWLME